MNSMRIIKTAVVLLAVIIVGLPVQAALHYIRAGATGAGNGNNWTDALPNFPAATAYVRGDTYYVAAGTYGQHDFSTPSSGTTLITIKKATVADHGVSTGWSDSYASGAADLTGTISFNSSYWLFDGQSRSTWTNGYGFTFTGPSPGGAGILIGDGVTDVRIQYVSGTGHGSTAPGSGGPAGDNAIWLNGTSRNITVSRCYFYSWGCCMVKTYTSSIESSTFEYCWFEWNRNSVAFHAEGVFPWGMNNSIWRYNVWVDIEGTGVIMLGNGANNQIYGSLVYWSSSYPHSGQEGQYIGNGTFTTWTAYTTTGNSFYNNTIIVPNSGGVEFGIKYPNTTSSGTARNNLYYCAGTGRNVYSTSVSSDYDVFYGLTHDSQANGVNGSGNPFVDSARNNYRLKAHTPSGFNLQSPYNTDMDEKIRATWDRGAFEYGVGGGNTNPTAQVSQSSLNFGVINVGTTKDLSFSLQNVGGGVLSGNISVGLPFQLMTSGSYSLGSNQSQTITVRYAPTTVANNTGTITFTGSATTVALTGQAITPPTPPAATFEAESGTITSPLTVTGGAISQNVTTGITDGGRAVYSFSISSNGVYTVAALVNAPSLTENSFYVNIDAEPTDPFTIWDIPVTTGYEMRTLSWRGYGAADSYSINPKGFLLSAGSHTLTLIGREANCSIDQIQIVAMPNLPLPPSGLTALGSP